MFTITDPGGETVDGLLIPPGAVAVQDGPAIEEVLFLRDEMANMAWAVERAVQGPSGAARDRARERDEPPPPEPGPVQRAQLDYLLQTGLPARWIPYLPRTSGYRAIELVQGAMTDDEGDPIRPRGRLLDRDDLKALKDAEVPREGITVQPSALGDPAGRRQLPAVDDAAGERRARGGREPARVRLRDRPQAASKPVSLSSVRAAAESPGRTGDKRLDLS